MFKLSQSKRSKYQDMIEGQMAAKDILTTVKEKTGFDPFTVDPDELPSTDEELSLYMNLNYKPAIEIAEEEAIDTMFAENHYEDTRKRIDYDQMVIGMGVAKHEFLTKSEGVKVEYVDPVNLVWSYTESPYFDDIYYVGEIKRVHLNELKKQFPELTEDELKEISSQSYNNNGFYDRTLTNYDEDDSNTVQILYYNYKTFANDVYKVKETATGAEKTIPKSDSFNPPEEMMEEMGISKLSQSFDVWYEGIMVMGTNIMLQWKMMENMVRPQSASQYAIPNYVAAAPRMYKGAIESLVRRMIPFADLIQITHLKLQQVIARVVPDGVFIDADGLNEVDLGTGQAYNPEGCITFVFSNR